MRSFLSLSGLFFKQLVHRKSVWLIVAIVAAMLLVGYFVDRTMQAGLEQGLSYDVATRQARSVLDTYADQVRGYALALAVLAAALVAPAARKEGSAQFVMALSVGRHRLAAAELFALLGFVSAATLVIHVGYAAAAWKVAPLTPLELAVGWVGLLVPLSLLATVVFSISLSKPAAVAWLALLGFPYLALPLTEAMMGELAGGVPMAVVRAVDNLQLLFPPLPSLIVWPRLSLGGRGEPPPHWGFEWTHAAFACAFWIALGVWLYRNLDLGSRAPTR